MSKFRKYEFPTLKKVKAALNKIKKNQFYLGSLYYKLQLKDVGKNCGKVFTKGYIG